MNNIFIIGNGFDLSHNFKTRYDQFLFYFLTSCIINKTDDEMLSIKLIKENKAKEFEIFESIEDFLKPENISYAYLSNTHEVELTTDSIVDYSLPIYHINFKSRFLYSIFHQNFVNYNNGLKYNRNWFNLEQSIYNFLEKTSKKTGVNAEQKEHEITMFNSTIRYISKKLTQYLKHESSTRSLKEKHVAAMSEFIKSFKREDSNNIFINYNYTNLIKKYALESGDIIYNIHGSIYDENIIIGYGATDKIYVNLLNSDISGASLYIKNHFYKKKGVYGRIDEKLNDPFRVIILGHSCESTDYTSLYRIFNHKDCIEVVPCYYDENDLDLKIESISRLNPKEDLISLTDDIKIPQHNNC